MPFGDRESEYVSGCSLRRPQLVTPRAVMTSNSTRGPLIILRDDRKTAMAFR